MRIAQPTRNHLEIMVEIADDYFEEALDHLEEGEDLLFCLACDAHAAALALVDHLMTGGTI